MDDGLCTRIYDHHLSHCHECDEENGVFCQWGSTLFDAAFQESEEWFEAFLEKLGPKGRQVFFDALRKKTD